MNRSIKLSLLKSWWSCTLLAAIHVASFAQQAVKSPQYFVAHFDASDGLIHDQFNAFINTDSKGFQWISSSNGIYRFDGKTFTNYLPERDSFQTYTQSNFFEDTLGRIWFSTIDAINYYDYKTDAVTSQVLAKAQNDFPPAYHIINYDSTRHEFLVSDGKDLLSYKPEASPATHTLSPTESIRYLPLPSKTDIIVLGFPWLAGPGLERFEIHAGQVVQFDKSSDPLIKQAQINGGLYDHLGQVWLGTDRGLVHYNVAEDIVIEVYPAPDRSSSEIWSPITYGELLLVSTSKNGIWLFDPKDRKYLYSLASQTINTGDKPKKSPRSLHQTPKGELFAMSNDGGIDVYCPVPNPAQEVLTQSGKVINVSALAEDQDGHIWVATTNGNLNHYTQKGKLLKSYVGKFNTNDPIRHLQSGTTKNQLYAQNDSNVYRIILKDNDQTLDIETLESFNQSILGLTISPNGHLMVRTRNAWYEVGEENTRQIHHQILDQSSSNDILKLSDDTFAFSPSDRRLYIFSYANNQITIVDSITTAGSVWSCKKVGNKNYILSTTNGLLSSNNDQQEYLSEKELYEFYIQDTGSYIALSMSGLMLKANNSQWQHRGKEIGLPARFDDESTLLVTKSHIWIGSEAGLFCINKPTESFTTQKNSKAYISKTWINDRPWAGGLLLDNDSLLLNYNENTIEVDVSLQQSIGVESSNIIYRLAGYQMEWAKLRGGSNLRFTQVTPGTYKLQIAEESSRGVTEQTTSIHIDIKPPFWQKWWFYALALFTLLGITALVVSLISRRRLIKERQKHEREQMIAAERDRIGKELHDDLGGELASILFLSQREVRKQPSTNSARIVELTKASLANMRDIIWALDSQDTSLGGLILYTQDYGAKMCADRDTDFQLTNEVNPRTGIQELSPRFRKNIFLIIKEAINNSLRHSQTPVIELSYTLTNEILKISILDKGKGFELKNTKLGNGVKNLKTRAKALGGECEISSTVGSGTTIQVNVPIT